MEINIYTDFLSKEEIEYLTGRKQKFSIIEQLNAMGIPFKKNANGYPIVRRDYDAPRSRRIVHTEPTENDDQGWQPAVLLET